MTSLRKPESMSVSRWISNWRSDIVSVFQRKTLYLLWKTNPSIRTCSRLFHFTCFERIAICTPLYVNSFDNRASSIGVSRYLGKECFSLGFVGSFGAIGCRCRRLIIEKLPWILIVCRQKSARFLRVSIIRIYSRIKKSPHSPLEITFLKFGQPSFCEKLNRSVY